MLAYWEFRQNNEVNAIHSKMKNQGFKNGNSIEWEYRIESNQIESFQILSDSSAYLKIESGCVQRRIVVLIYQRQQHKGGKNERWMGSFVDSFSLKVDIFSICFDDGQTVTFCVTPQKNTWNETHTCREYTNGNDMKHIY